MKKNSGVARIPTGIRNFDALFEGGLPKSSVIVVAGSPGTGKTTLTQQICFHTASLAQPVLYFSTLSEPTAKTLRNLRQFAFFDAAKLDSGAMQFIDLGVILRTSGLEDASKLVMEQVKKIKPAIVVIDSFRVFDDLARSREELRKFDYEIAINLMAWEVTTFLLGEYGTSELSGNPLFSVVDGLFVMSQREQSGEQQRFLQPVKLRGTQHSRDEHAFIITSAGIELYSPRMTLQREDRGPGTERCKTGITKFDDLVGEGIPRGSSLLIAGVAGTGKTVLLLEFLYQGAKAGEKGIIFSFEETEERLLASAHGLGWQLQEYVDSGLIEVVFIAQPDIMVERHLQMMQDRVEAMQARRVAIDSVSVFMHRIKDPQVAREKVFQLASIVQNTQAVGFFATDIPYGANQLSRFGVEETVVDGIVLLTSIEEGLERQRYIEIYKLRNTAHLKGRHHMSIGPGGITVFPRYNAEESLASAPPLQPERRLSAGVPGLDPLCGGGLIECSVTLVSGSAGIGKSTLGLQFLLEGAQQGQPGLYVALEEGPAQILAAAESLGLPLREAAERGLVEIMYLSNEYVRSSQFLALLDDKIGVQKTRRLVLDSVSHMTRQGAAPDSVRQLLYAMIARFKAAEVTTLLMLEADSLYSTDTVTERGYSPVADNILLLRYAQTERGLTSTVSVVKTRGSAHDWNTYCFSIANGGIRIGEPYRSSAPSPALSSSGRTAVKE